MDNPHITPRAPDHHRDLVPAIAPALAPVPAAAGLGEWTTFYSWQSGPARSLVLADMARLLASRHAPAAPVLMIDWDLESPGLHYLFGAAGEADNARPGLLELIESCRSRYGDLVQATLAAGGTPDADTVARQALAGVDWHSHIERVDADCPLYMLRAGRFDHNYGERAARLDWHGLYLACPGLLRQFRAQLAEAYRHIFIDARCGRSAAVSVCTALLPDRIVGLFTPHMASLDGLCGTVERAIAYRVSHEDEQRPLLLYPLPCLPAGGSADARRWRRGVAGGGYQDRLEALMRTSYSRPQLSLESYCDDILLDPACFSGQDRTDASAAKPAAGAPARTLAMVLDWFGRFPWQASNASHHIHPRIPLHEPSRGAAAEASKQESQPAQPPQSLHARSLGLAGRAQFPALRRLAVLPRAQAGTDAAVRAMPARTIVNPNANANANANTRFSAIAARTPARQSGFEAPRESVLDGSHMRRLVDAVEIQLDQLQQMVDQQALREARPLADKLRDLVLRPAVAQAMRRRGAALIKLVYRHDNDTDALLEFSQDELDALERVLSEAEAGRPLACS
jgi:hypothetical protein